MKELDAIVACVCPICGKEQDIRVNEEDYLNFKNHVLLAYEAFPYLSADEREAVISGVCPTCWDEMWEDDEDC